MPSPTLRRIGHAVYEVFAAAGCVVDVGCGTGTAARELASRVDHVVGVDASRAMIEVARIRSGERPDLRFVVGDALSLPLDDASVDGYRAERLFQHLPDHAAALSEARRVLRPGGRIAVIDQDWDTLIFASQDVETTRRVAAAMADSIAGGTGARNLAAGLDAAGFTQAEVRGHVTVSRDANAYGFVADLAADAAIAAGERIGRSWSAGALLSALERGTAPGWSPSPSWRRPLPLPSEHLFGRYPGGYLVDTAAIASPIREQPAIRLGAQGRA